MFIGIHEPYTKNSIQNQSHTEKLNPIPRQLFRSCIGMILTIKVVYNSPLVKEKTLQPENFALIAMIMDQNMHLPLNDN
jgi:hypothetical protein